MADITWLGADAGKIPQELRDSWEVNVFHPGEKVALTFTHNESIPAGCSAIFQFWERSGHAPFHVARTIVCVTQDADQVTIRATYEMAELQGRWPDAIFIEARRIDCVYSLILTDEGAAWAMLLEPGSSDPGDVIQTPRRLANALGRRARAALGAGTIDALQPLLGEFLIAEYPGGRGDEVYAALWTSPLGTTDQQMFRATLRAILHSSEPAAPRSRPGEDGHARGDHRGGFSDDRD